MKSIKKLLCYALGLCLVGVVTVVGGCGQGSKTAEFPVVTEETMTPEQKAQWEKMKQDGTAGDSAFIADFMQKQMQAQTNAQGGEKQP